MAFVLPEIPHKPGVYLFKDSDGKILYIGKAKDLKKRVSSYFTKQHEIFRIRRLVDAIADLDFIITASENEAFLLENKLIKQHKPKFNIELKHGERYAYIRVSNEEYPRLHTARYVKKDGSTYFGPFSSGATRYFTVKALNTAFKLRACKKMPKQVCLYYHIGRCSGPCQDKISKQEYNANVNNAITYLEGKGEALLKTLESEMKQASADKNYEVAAQKRDALYGLQRIGEQQVVDRDVRFNQDIFGVSYAKNSARYVVVVINVKKGSMTNKSEYVFENVVDTSSVLSQAIMQYYDYAELPSEILFPKDEIQSNDFNFLQDFLQGKSDHALKLHSPQRGVKRKLLEIATENASFALHGEDATLDRLQKLLCLPEPPKVIECFDISTLLGKYTVASMVQFRDGKPDKSNYRRFKIKYTDLSAGPDDFASISEVVFRRYKKILLERSTPPDLIVIDGGKGQLSAALSSLKKLDMHIPIVSLAKKMKRYLYLVKAIQ